MLTVAMLWPATVETPEGSDKLVQLIAFAALTFSLARTGRFGFIPVFIGSSAFEAAIELIQPTFNRSADIGDWVANTVGGCHWHRLPPPARRLKLHWLHVTARHGCGGVCFGNCGLPPGYIHTTPAAPSCAQTAPRPLSACAAGARVPRRCPVAQAGRSQN